MADDKKSNDIIPDFLKEKLNKPLSKVVGTLAMLRISVGSLEFYDDATREEVRRGFDESQKGKYLDQTPEKDPHKHIAYDIKALTTAFDERFCRSVPEAEVTGPTPEELRFTDPKFNLYDKRNLTDDPFVVKPRTARINGVEIETPYFPIKEEPHEFFFNETPTDATKPYGARAETKRPYWGKSDKVPAGVQREVDKLLAGLRADGERFSEDLKAGRIPIFHTEGTVEDRLPADDLTCHPDECYISGLLIDEKFSQLPDGREKDPYKTFSQLLPDNKKKD